MITVNCRRQQSQGERNHPHFIWLLWSQAYWREMVRHLCEIQRWEQVLRRYLHEERMSRHWGLRRVVKSSNHQNIEDRRLYEGIAVPERVDVRNPRDGGSHRRLHEKSDTKHPLGRGSCILHWLYDTSEPHDNHRLRSVPVWSRREIGRASCRERVLASV